VWVCRRDRLEPVDALQDLLEEKDTRLFVVDDENAHHAAAVMQTRTRENRRLSVLFRLARSALM
jgi:hypothetical protein